MNKRITQVMALGLCWSGLAGCEKQTAVPTEQAAATEVPTAAFIAKDLSSGNYERAAKAAQQAVAANPADAESHLLLARAEARLQNVGAAVAALQAAFDAGFHDPRGALNNPDFDGIRANPIFAKFASQFERKAQAAVGQVRSAPVSSIRAGDVSITENDDGSSRIRAGDIELRD